MNVIKLTPSILAGIAIAALAMTTVFETASLNATEAQDVIPVTLDNYKVAESDLAFHNITKLVGTGKFFHFPVDEFDLNNQTVVRMNQDTIYSGAIINVSQGASITLPETDGRYMSAMVVQNDHYIDQVFKTPGEHEIKAATDFVMVALRIRINKNDPNDSDKVRALQQATKISAKATEPHVMPNYDMEQLVALRDKLAAEAAELGSLNNMQGARGTVDERMHLLGTAAGWGSFSINPFHIHIVIPLGVILSVDCSILC